MSVIKKKSFDFTPEMLYILKKYKTRLGTKTNADVIRKLLFFIDAIDNAPSDFKRQLYDHCVKNIALCNTNIQITSSPFATKKLNDEKEFYLSILQMFFGKNDSQKTDSYSLKHIKIKNGTLRIPEHWTILNYDDELSYERAIVCEFSEESEPYYCVYLVPDDAFDMCGNLKSNFIAECHVEVNKRKEFLNKDYTLYALKVYPNNVNLSRIYDPFGACIISED